MKPSSSDNKDNAQTFDKQILTSLQQRKKEKELQMAMQSIEKRASKREKAIIQGFATYDISPFNSFYLRHVNSISYCALECFHATFFHFIDTVKVRGMSRSIIEDTSFYFKNTVQTKPLISGVVSGFLGAAAGSITFISTYNTMTYLLYANKKYSDWDFRLKNFLIYMTSDFTASFARIFFETRKQLIQMANYDTSLQQIVRGSYIGWFPLMFRDVSFRSIILAFYYATTDVQHSPKLKYSVPQIADIMRQRRQEGHYETFDEISYLFYDFHNYEVKTKLHIRYLYFLGANVLATLITNPIDVCLSKILTQQQPKYTGFFHCFFTVYKEEGPKKFLSGIHPRFMLNFFNGVLYLFVYDRFVQHMAKVYD